MEFTNPSDAGPVMNTISAFCQLVPAGMTTLPHRSTDGTIFVVVQGSGQARIGAETYALSEGDIFVAPSWSRRTLSAQSDLVLFSYSDRAAQEKLGLWREAVEADDV
jgi:gentisate 1,2-dioxygenase